MAQCGLFCVDFSYSSSPLPSSKRRTSGDQSRLAAKNTTKREFFQGWFEFCRITPDSVDAHHLVRAQDNAAFPYMEVLKETIFPVEGKPYVTGIQTWAIRADGSQAIKLDSPAPHPLSERVINFATDERVILDDLHRAKSTEQHPNVYSESWIKNPAAQCFAFKNGQRPEGQSVAGTEMIGGYQTTKIISANMTWWYAPNQGCAIVKFMADFVTSRSEQELISLVPGEPARSLFDVPANYREEPPSQLHCSFASSDTPPCDTSNAALRRQNAEYYAHHP